MFAPACDQGLNRRDPAFARRKQQRRESAVRPHVDVGAAGDQSTNDIGIAFGGGPHQRGLSVPAFFRIHRRAMTEQHLHRLDPAGASGRHQHRLALRHRGVRVGAGLQECFDDGRVSIHARQPERRDAVAIGGVDVGAGANQKLDERGARPDRRRNAEQWCRRPPRH